MSRRDHDDDLDDIPSLVPDRDDVASRQRSRGSAPAPLDEPVRAGGGTSGAVRLLLSVLVLGMLATGAAGYLFYTEGRTAMASLENANARLLELERRLSAVGENSEETALNIIERIDFNFSEIDKLWAARNTNRANIGENRAGIDEIKGQLGEVEQALSNQATMINQNGNQVAALENRLETLGGNISELETMSRRLAELSTGLDELNAALNGLDSNLNRRLDTVEQDIESINVYRLSLNQDISAMRDSISQLQERLRQP